MSMRARALIPAAALILLAGASLTTMRGPNTARTAEAAVDQFIAATVTEDQAGMARLMGGPPGEADPMAATFGHALGTRLTTYWRGRAQRLADYRWATAHAGPWDSGVRILVDLHRPDYRAWAHRTDELLGFTTDAVGQLVAPDEPAMTVEDAERLTRADQRIRPIHYHVPVRVIRQRGRWVLDPASPTTAALVDVIRRGDLSTRTAAYLRP